MFFLFFFFQAEDGIRDLVRSRGLGDVYKRQAGAYSAEDLKSRAATLVINGAGEAKLWSTETLDITLNGFGSVSYYGSPQVTQALHGLGTITSLGDK